MHQISPDPLTLEQVGHILSTGEPIAISAEAANRIGHCRLFLEKKLAAYGETFYGINTGFEIPCKARI